MHHITIFSLNRNNDSLKEALGKSVFSKKQLYPSGWEVDIALGNNKILNLVFLKEFEESYFALKHEVLVNFESLEVKNELLKFQLINYIKEAKGVVNILCESGFNDEAFLTASNLSKIFDGIIFMDGVMINSDSKIILDLNGNSETEDFLGRSELFPMELNDNAYLNILKEIPLELNGNLPSIDEVQEIKIRDKEELVKRALALTFLGSYAESIAKLNNVESVRNFLFNQCRKYDIVGAFSENELNFLFNNKPGDREIESFSKSYEFANLLFWVLSLTETLTFPPESALNHKLLMAGSKFLNLEEMVKSSFLKDEEVIVKNFDLNYRLLDTAVENMFLGKEIPELINIELLKQRDKTFKWITTYRNFDWDKI